MKRLAILLLALTSMLNTVHSRQPIIETPDRTITWHSWQDEAEFRVRTGDRYIGHGRWEHYLGFEERTSVSKEIKISMIHLAKDPTSDILLAPGRRYGIAKVTDSTARKRNWSWVLQEEPTSRQDWQ
jgi:hypothetical protein